ncbi:hypothetical protein pdam_00024044 [Pocillopora damicornis]|uniref:Uncharacterized protein n=1 Tax=Pocillopora damicornis TaxID=46731 RepID=A0A3M6TIK5_POCDA|nr:hypothetical protein pdam_00024044 [Pocillopora damicornis]
MTHLHLRETGYQHFHLQKIKTVQMVTLFAEYVSTRRIPFFHHHNFAITYSSDVVRILLAMGYERGGRG